MDSDDNYYLNSKINFPSSNCIHDFTIRVDMERALLFLSFIDLIYEWSHARIDLRLSQANTNSMFIQAQLHLRSCKAQAECQLVMRPFNMNPNDSWKAGEKR